MFFFHRGLCLWDSTCKIEPNSPSLLLGFLTKPVPFFHIHASPPPLTVVYNHPEPVCSCHLRRSCHQLQLRGTLCWNWRALRSISSAMLCSVPPKVGPLPVANGLWDSGKQKAGDGGQPSEIGRKQGSFKAKPLRRTGFK